LDISGNVFNDCAVGFYNRMGVVPVVSPELSFDELSGFSDKRFCVYAHGRVPLMSTKYALPVDRLVDEKGMCFRCAGRGNISRSSTVVPLGLYNHVLRLMDAGIMCFLLDLDCNVSETVSVYKKILSGEKAVEKPPGEYTLGNYRRGVQ